MKKLSALFLFIELLLIGASYAQTPLINSISPTIVCQGSEVTLNLRYDATQVQWKQNGNVVSTTNSFTYVAAVSGSTVAGGNGNGYQTANQFYNAKDFCVDAAGNIFVSDFGNNWIVKWSVGATTGTVVAGYGRAHPSNGTTGVGNDANQLNNPAGICVDAAGNLYIADQYNHRVQKWAPGALFGTTVAGGNGEGSANYQLSYPNYVSVDAAGNVYVADYGNNRIQKWAPGATSGTTVANLRSIILSRLTGMFVDASGYIYVLDAGYEYVQKFTPGNPEYWTSEILFPVGPSTSSLSVDEFGNVYFTNHSQSNNYNKVGKWDAITGQISYFGSVAGSASNRFNNPTSVFVDKIGSIYVCDNLNDRIQKWNQNKTASYSPINSGSLAGLVTNAVGISSQSSVVTVNAKSSSTSNVNICSNELPYVWNGVNRTAAGTYTYITTNSKGCDSTATLVLTVQSTSTTINNLLPSRICLGNTVTLNVRSDATQVQWLLNGNVVSTDNNLALFPEAITSTIVAGGNGYGYNMNQLYLPSDVFVDGSGNVYVSDYANSRVMKWPPGATRGYLAAGDAYSGNLNYQLYGADGVFIDKMGNLYVSDSWNNRIMKWAVGATTGVTVAGGNGQNGAANQLNHPRGVFVDTAGNIYISDFDNHRIQKWAPGATSGTTVAGGNGRGSALNQFKSPNGLFVDLSGNVYVSDSGNNRIMKWLPGATSGTIVAGGNGWGSALNQFKSPSGVSVDNIGNIYVSDEGNSRIQKWAPGSMNGTTVVIQNRPNGIFVDAAGNIFYSDENEHTVRKFPAAYKTSSYTPTNGGVLTAVVSNGTGCSAKSTTINVNSPIINSISPSIVCSGSAVTINVSNDVQQVKWKINGDDVSTTTSLISVPTVVGTTVAGSSAGVSGSSPNQLSLPSNVFVDAIGNLYIADQNNHRVQKWAPGATTGITVAGGNGNGSAENQLSYPTNVFVDKYGTIYVCDNDNHRIQRWVIGATKGITVAGGNGAGSAANQLNGPLSVFVDSIGTIYVSDPNNYRVQKWTSGSTTGTTVAGGNGMGSAPNQIEFPYGIFVDINGSVYISDFTANRIQKWAPGATSGITVAGGNGAGSAANQLDGPLGVFVDAMGNIYVSELNNDRVQKWAPGATTGITIAGGNGNGNAANQLNTPTGIFIDAKGDFYISDGNNHRVQKWSAITLSANFIPTNAGSLTATVTNTNGCDAISIPVTVKKSTSTTNVSICPIDLPYRWNGVNRTAAGTYTYNTTDSKGCDSIATLVLTVNTTSTSTTILSICQNVYGQPYSWNGANITASGTYTYITTNSKGCDSTATLILTINAISETTKYVTICSNALPYNWNGVNRTAGGTYIYKTTNILGCDSTVVLFLTVKATSTSITNVSICSSALPYNWNGVNRTAAGTYNYITTNRVGCDSTATLVLTVKASSTSITNVSICPSSLPYGWNGINRISSGTYTYITTNSVGCDSTATLVLTVKATSTSTSNVSICSSDLPYSWNGISRISSGNYAFNTTNSVGCDSTATLVLTVRATSASTTNVSICSSSLPYSWNGLTFTSFGTQTAYSTNAEGCDNAATLNLISSDPIINSISPSNICLGNGATLNLSSDAIQVQWKLNGTTVSTNTSLTSVPAADTTIARRGFTVAGGKGAGAAANQLNSPTDVFVDAIGNIYVSDYYNNRIQKWAVGDTIGTTVAGGNGIGRASNQLFYPEGVFVDAIGNLYISDLNNHRIQKWAPGATFGTTVAGGNGYGSASNQLSYPQVVFVDSSGNIYVADTYNDRIQKWAPGATSGTTVAGGNGYGSTADRLNLPTGVFVDAIGNLYISDLNNHRIQKWAPGATFGTTVAGGNGYGSASNQLSYPEGVFVDSNGNIYVSDGANHRIQKWAVGATMGITVAGGNGAGNTINHLNYPNGVFVDASGNIYVSDNGNNRIQKWSAETQSASYIPTSSGGLTAVVTNAAGCSTSSSTLTVSTPVIPTFTAIAAICSVDSLSALPTTSNNNITGSWTPPLNNLETTTYTFTPNLGVCATVASLTIAVNPVPTNIVATGINNGGYISFTAPQGTGITNYQYSLDNGANWISPSPAVTRSPLVISNGLNNCTTYQVRLRAVTATCFGPASAQASFTPTNSILPGVNWTSFDQSYLSNNSYSVTYGNGLFVAVGYNNASYSTDGITWTSANTPSSNNSWRSVTYGNGLFVAVAQSGTGNRVMTSPDGVTWTSRTPSANNSWSSITYGNGLFVAVSFNGVGNRVMTSPDGVTWTSRTSAANNNWASITYGDGLFVAVSANGVGNRVMTSPDGITWTSRTTQIAKSWRSVTYGNGLFVAISMYDNLTTGNDVMTSQDGITWTNTSSSFDADWHSIAYGNGLFVAIRGTASGPNDDVTTISSSDGINWTPNNYQFFSGYTLCLTYGNGSFVSVGDYNISLISTYQVAANAPSIDSVTKSGSSAVVAFTTSLPTNLESTAVTNFEYSLDNGSTWITPSPTVTTSPLIIENLANGNYQLKIRAVNSIGISCPTAMTAFTICSNVGAASGTPTVCSNSALTNIIHTTTGITGIGIATGLPAGVTASWANDTIKITGTPTDSGTFNYNIPLAGGCGAISATGTITVNALPEVSIAGNTTICAGAVSTLTIQSNIIAPAQSIPLDEVAGASLAVGLRRLRTAYTGSALRLRRSSDNQEQDFGFAGNDLDVNAISTWLNGASAYCTKLYDQSGNGGDVSQTNASAQPLLVISGINNNPSLRFTTAQNMFNAVNYPAPFSVIYGSKVIGTSARVLAAKNNNWLLGYWGGSEDRAFFDGWVSLGNTPTVANQYNIYAATGTGSISTVYKNGAQIASNGSGLTGPNGIQLNGAGYGGSPTETSNCEFTDVVIYGSVLSQPNMAKLNNSIAMYYGGEILSPISCLWSTGANSASIAVNAVGNYAVTVTDNTTGCSAVSTVTVKNPSSTTNVSICSSATPYLWNGGSYTSSGVYTFTANSTLGCDSIATLNLTINSCTTTLNVTAFLEGFYSGNGTMRANLYDLGISTNDTETDSVDVNLWSVANLSSSTPDFTVRSVLHTNGTLTAVFPGATLNNSYYVALKHRNSIELWSAAPVTIASTTNHDFSSSLSSAFSDGFSEPLKWMNGNKYAMFSGDINQDGTVDLFDAQITDNGAANLFFGYDASDCNGDGSTDLFDLQLIDNNSTLLLFYSRPF